MNRDTKKPEPAEQPGNTNEQPLSSSAEVEVEVDDPTGPGRPLASGSELAGVQTPTSDSGTGMPVYTPTRSLSASHSGAQTPVSPGPGPRTVRFSPADHDELATVAYLTTQRAGGTQPPTASAGRAVRFPEDVVVGPGPGPGENGSASASVSAVSASQPARGPDAPDAVGGVGLEAKMDGGATLGRDASVVSAQ